MALSKDEMSTDKGTLSDKGTYSNDSGVVTQDVKMNTIEGKKYQPESNADSSVL